MIKKILTAIICTSVVLVTMGAADGCEAEQKPTKIKTKKTSPKLQLMSSGKTHKVTESREGTWTAPKSNKNCTWIIIPKEGKAKKGKYKRFGGNTVTLSYPAHSYFSSVGCGIWTKR